MDFSELECGVCTNVFSDIHCPMLLPCSHTFCAYCIERIISTQIKICPICREPFTATTARDLTLVRSILNMAKQFSSKGHKAPSRGPKESFQETINDFKEKLAIKETLDAEEETVSIIKYFESLKDDALKFKEGNEEIVNELQDLLNNIDENIGFWTNKMTVIRQGKHSIKDLCRQLDEVTSYSSAGPIMDRAKEVQQNVQENIKEKKELLQKYEVNRKNTRQIILDWKVRTSRIATQMLKRIEDFEKDVIKVNDLKGLLELLSWKSQREIIAVQEFQGTQRVATIKVESGNTVALSHLREGNLPKKCFVTEVDPLIEKSSRRTFLDLGVDGRLLGRMIIKLKDDCFYARNFLHLCVGDLGPSYANSNLMGVGNRGMDGEYVYLGEYEENGTKSTNAVLSGIDWTGEDKREIYGEPSWKSGLVGVSANTSYDSGSKFYIISRDDPSSGVGGCFGMVEEGIDVLRNAILQTRDIRSVKIIDSGLLVSI